MCDAIVFTLGAILLVIGGLGLLIQAADRRYDAYGAS